jgi:hypothetical protein
VPSSRSSGRIARCVGALLVAATVCVPSVQAGTEPSEVVFRLTLEGPVPRTHTFAILCGTIEPEAQNPCFGPETIWVVCTPPTASPFDDALEPCAAGTYEVVVSGAGAGQTVEYSMLRWTTADLSHTDEMPEEHLAGSLTVRQGRQVVSLGFVYPGGEAPTLPDTAMPAP